MIKNKISINGISKKASDSSSGTLGRAVYLLKLVAANQVEPLRLTDLVELSSLDRSTVHRLLQRLVLERMLVRDAKGMGYRLGPLLYELGLGSLPDNNLRHIAQSAMRRLADATGDMAFLIARSGYETVCLDRVAGTFAIQTLVGGVGDRHPLGIGAGGPAILSVLGEEDSEAIYRAVEPGLARYGLNVPILRERVASARKCGYALDDGVTVKGVTAVARPILNRFDAPVGAVFIASIQSRMTSDRCAEVDKHLLICVREIAAALRD